MWKNCESQAILKAVGLECRQACHYRGFFIVAKGNRFRPDGCRIYGAEKTP
jgi:hypothetical protein